ncbi:Asp23/Gls24 family envelope stress response protein [Olsenella uli]|uniref:Asp23/Gls24 family envelope stress response protein n=1 Tax=Olsenella uli TaxID=133926 RepID=UPI00311A0095
MSKNRTRNHFSAMTAGGQATGGELVPDAASADRAPTAGTQDGAGTQTAEAKAGVSAETGAAGHSESPRDASDGGHASVVLATTKSVGVESAGADPAGTGLSASAVTDDLADDEDLDSEDSLTFSNGVIEKIVALAMRDVPGVIGMKGSWFNRVQETFGTTDSRKGVTVEVTPEASVRVNISVLIEYGAYAPQVFEDVKRAVVKQVSGMTGLSVAGVNLRIEDVLTAEEAAARNRAAAAADAGGMDPAPTEATDARAASATVAPASAAASAAEKGSALAAEGE